MTFAEYVDILVQIIYAKFKNDRTMSTQGATKFENFRFETDFSSLYFIVVLKYNIQIAPIYCQGYWQYPINSVGFYLIYFHNYSALNCITLSIFFNTISGLCSLSFKIYCS